MRARMLNLLGDWIFKGMFYVNRRILKVAFTSQPYWLCRIRSHFWRTLMRPLFAWLYVMHYRICYGEWP